MSDDLTDEQLWALTSDADASERAAALSELGHRLFDRREYSQCLAVTEQAAELFNALGDDERAGRNLYGAAACHCRLGRHDEAVATWAKAADAFRLGATESDIADCELRAAECLQALERVDEARRHFQSALDLYSSDGATQSVGQVALALAELEGGEGDFDTASELQERSRTCFQQLGAAPDVARATDRLAASRIEQGRLTEALDLLEYVLHVRMAQQDPLARAYARYRLGWTLNLADRNADAGPLLEEATRVFREHDELLMLAQCELQLAHAYSGLGDHETAQALYRRTSAVFDACGRPDQARLARANLAIDLERTGLLEEAASINERLVREASEEEDSSQAMAVSTRLARNLLDLGRAHDALSVVEAAAVDPTSGVAEVARFTAVRAKALLATGSHEQAALAARAVLDRLDGTSHLTEQAQGHAVLSDVALHQGDLASGETHRARAVALFLAAGQIDEATDLSRWFLNKHENTKDSTST